MNNKYMPKIRVALTSICQLRCSFCGGNDNKMENFQPETQCKNLNINQLKKILKAYFDNGGKTVQFTGGEPLLYNKLEEIIRFVHEHNGIAEINTNGIALTQELTYKLKKAGLKIIKVSLPAFDKENYEKITGINAFETVIKNIIAAHKLIDIRINTVVSKKNDFNILNWISVCKTCGVKQLLLLEYLYYPHVQSITDFDKCYINIRKKYGDLLEKISDTDGEIIFDNIFEHIHQYSCNDFDIFVKDSDKSLRINDCKRCSNFCQEGVYELRLSTGGYLSFCNIVNGNGTDCSKLNEAQLDEIMKNYLKIFKNTFTYEKNSFF